MGSKSVFRISLKFLLSHLARHVFVHFRYRVVRDEIYYKCGFISRLHTVFFFTTVLADTDTWLMLRNFGSMLY